MQRLISPLGSSFVHKVGTANTSTTSLILGISYRREPELEEGLAGLIFNPYDSVTAIAQETEPGVTPCCHQPQSTRSGSRLGRECQLPANPNHSSGRSASHTNPPRADTPECSSPFAGSAVGRPPPTPHSQPHPAWVSGCSHPSLQLPADVHPMEMVLLDWKGGKGGGDEIAVRAPHPLHPTG